MKWTEKLGEGGGTCVQRCGNSTFGPVPNPYWYACPFLKPSSGGLITDDLVETRQVGVVNEGELELLEDFIRDHNRTELSRPLTSSLSIVLSRLRSGLTPRTREYGT